MARPCVLGVLCVPSVHQRAVPDAGSEADVRHPAAGHRSADGTVSVRLIRGELSNNITGSSRRAPRRRQGADREDRRGGARGVPDLPAGATVKAVAVVDGERLESQEFPVPAQGGIRLMLVATDKDKDRPKPAAASAPAIAGQVVIGGQSRIVIEPGDEAVDVYLPARHRQQQRARR